MSIFLQSPFCQLKQSFVLFIFHETCHFVNWNNQKCLAAGCARTRDKGWEIKKRNTHICKILSIMDKHLSHTQIHDNKKSTLLAPSNSSRGISKREQKTKKGKQSGVYLAPKNNRSTRYVRKRCTQLKKKEHKYHICWQQAWLWCAAETCDISIWQVGQRPAV